MLPNLALGQRVEREGYGLTVELYPLARAASRVQKCNAKGYNWTVQLCSLASRVVSCVIKYNAKGYSWTVRLYPLASHVVGRV